MENLFLFRFPKAGVILRPKAVPQGLHRCPVGSTRGAEESDIVDPSSLTLLRMTRFDVMLSVAKHPRVRFFASLRMTLVLFNIGLLLISPTFPGYASEVIQDSHTRVVVREHPKTGKPYVSIVPADIPLNAGPLGRYGKISKRPDYRMLDPKVKSGEIPYEGPYSDSRKIYVFAATLATLGTVGGAIGMVAVPVTTGGAASGGGAYLAAGAATAVGSAAGAVASTKSDRKSDNFVQTSRSQSTAVTSSKESA